MQTSIIVPIIAVLALLIKSVFGIEIGQELQTQFAEGLTAFALAVVAVFGIIKSHKSKNITNLK
jgi:uncharacterized membrane protein